jgi:hypothetical protein
VKIENVPSETITGVKWSGITIWLMSITYEVPAKTNNEFIETTAIEGILVLTNATFELRTRRATQFVVYPTR